MRCCVRSGPLARVRRFRQAADRHVRRSAADILITASLVYYLRRHRAETYFEETQTLLDKVMVNTIENNGLVGLF
jgi:hypothetical protein